MTNSQDSTTSRRRFLLATATAASFGGSGCINRLPWSNEPDPPPFGPIEHGWGMAGRDPAHTNRNMQANGPSDDPEVIWEFDGDDNPPYSVIEDELLAIATQETLSVFDLAAGELAYSTDVYTRLSKPVLYDGRIYVKQGERELVCLEGKTGETLWNFHTVDTITRSPGMADELVLIGSHYDERQRMLYALDRETGTEKWRTTVLQAPSHRSGYRIYGGYVYEPHDNNLVTIDLTTGEKDPLIPNISSRPRIVDEILYFGAGRTEERGIRANTLNGEKLWEVDLHGGVGSTTPTVVNGDFYVVSGSKILGFDTATREKRMEEDVSVPQWLVTDGSTVYVGSGYRSWNLYIVDTQTQEVNSFRFSDSVRVLSVVDEMLFISMPGKLKVLV